MTNKGRPSRRSWISIDRFLEERPAGQRRLSPQELTGCGASWTNGGRYLERGDKANPSASSAAMDPAADLGETYERSQGMRSELYRLKIKSSA